MYVCMHVCIYVSKYRSMCLCLCVRVPESRCVHSNMSLGISPDISRSRKLFWACLCKCVCMIFLQKQSIWQADRLGPRIAGIQGPLPPSIRFTQRNREDVPSLSSFLHRGSAPSNIKVSIQKDEKCSYLQTPKLAGASLVALPRASSHGGIPSRSHRRTGGMLG